MENKVSGIWRLKNVDENNKLTEPDSTIEQNINFISNNKSYEAIKIEKE